MFESRFMGAQGLRTIFSHTGKGFPVRITDPTKYLRTNKLAETTGRIYFHGPFQSNNGGGRNSNRPPVLQALPICAAPTIEYYIFLGMSNPSFKGIPSFIGSG